MKRKTLALFLVSFLVGGIFIATAARVYAAYSPFGGMILYRHYCECPVPGFIVVVSGPVGGNFLYVPGATQLFPNFNILGLGNWVLGLHTGVPVGCGHYSHGYCADQVPTRGIMTMVGTS